MEHLMTVKHTTSTRIQVTGATVQQQAACLGATLMHTAVGDVSMSKIATAGACNCKTTTHVKGEKSNDNRLTTIRCLVNVLMVLTIIKSKAWTKHMHLQ
mmetsp:Transcript_3353/g.5109  ORF Transcript_3353/g.5109 Transcript_3353/m.5109 type:complete len:99 (+) Transcript_3353:652-948(+)